MNSDLWLERWLPLVSGRSAGRRVLELGCGNGCDSLVLASAGLDLIGIDISPHFVAEAQVRVPKAEFKCQDLRAPFPVEAGAAGVIVASLSLHYFPWLETLAVVERIQEALCPHGMLLCRLNSTHDHNHGASGHSEIEEHYYNVEGKPKRFFDHSAVKRLFAKGWRTLACEELVIQRYALPKVVWEVILEQEA